MVAQHGVLHDGYAVVDDFEFLFDTVECETRPPEPPATTTTTQPDQCHDQPKCEDGKGCYTNVRIRNLFFLSKYNSIIRINAVILLMTVLILLMRKNVLESSCLIPAMTLWIFLTVAGKSCPMITLTG